MLKKIIDRFKKSSENKIEKTEEVPEEKIPEEELNEANQKLLEAIESEETQFFNIVFLEDQVIYAYDSEATLKSIFILLTEGKLEQMLIDFVESQSDVIGADFFNERMDVYINRQMENIVDLPRPKKPMILPPSLVFQPMKRREE